MNAMRWVGLVVFGLGVAAMTGCEDGGYNHTPPAGQGSLVLDNNTSDDIDVFLNGTSQGRVRDGGERIFDLSPGVYRLVLSEKDGFRTFRDDIDLLEGRLSILDIRSDSQNFTRYQVTLEID